MTSALREFTGVRIFSVTSTISIFLIGTVIAASGSNGRIINGDSASPGEFPGALSLGLSSWGHIHHVHQCGGVILTETWVVTTAKCVADAVNNTNKYYWLAGTNNLQQSGSQHAIQKVVIHPGYNVTDSWIHNIALVEVNQPFEFSTNVQPVTLPSSSRAFPAVGSDSIVIGWGQVSDFILQPSLLQKAEVQISDGDFCRRAYGIWNMTVHEEFQFCAGPLNDVRGVCTWDDGGPLYPKNEDDTFLIIGIVSWSHGCGLPDYPTVYIRISAYLDWIQEIVGQLL